MIDALLHLLSYLATLVREVPPGSNEGERVEGVIRWGGGVKGQSWCAYLVYFVGSLACAVAGKVWPLPRTGSCEMLRQFALRKKILRSEPSVGDVYVLLNGAGVAHHTGFVRGFTETHFDETSGNTTDPKSTNTPSSEGLGCFENSRKLGPQYAFIHWQDLA